MQITWKIRQSQTYIQHVNISIPVAHFRNDCFQPLVEHVIPIEIQYHVCESAAES